MSIATIIDGIVIHAKDMAQDEVDCLHENDGHATFRIDKQIHTVEEVSVNRELHQVSFRMNGKDFTVSILDEVDILAENLGFSKVDQADNNLVKAPMPGLVLDILVEEGSKVEEGEPLLILEAMKMENVIKSPVSGMIKSIEIEKSSSVDKHQLLIELDV